MKARKKSLRAALYPAAAAVSLLLLAQQSFAAAPTSSTFDQWSVSSGTISADCPIGYSCGAAVTGDGFFQRQIIDSDAGEKTYFQTIITDTGVGATTPNLAELTDESFVGISETVVVEQPLPTEDLVTQLSCPEGFTCGDVITGNGFLQQEFTDGSYFWFQTLPENEGIIKRSAGGLSTPLCLFHATTGLTLKPGKHLTTTGGMLVDQPANLHLSRDKITADPDYIDLNQQSDDTQKIYHHVIDTEITDLSAGAKASLSAQLNVPLEIPNGSELRPRVLTAQGWIDFVTDGHSHIASAPKLDTGFCPEPGSALYQQTFAAGSECLQFTIQDGGPNDGDGAADGKVALTTGVILKALPVSATSTVIEVSDNPQVSADNGGGGVWPWWLSLAAVGLFFRHNRGQRRAV